MKNRIISFLVIPLFAVVGMIPAWAQDEGGKKSADSKENGRLSDLFKKAWKSGETLSDDENEEFLSLIPTILPGKDYLGDDLEWRLLFKDSNDGDSDLLTVNLAKKGSSPYAREMWFHLTYKSEIPKQYGNAEFEGFQAMGLPGVHLLVLVGHLEIRAVAAADAYKRQSKIDEVLAAFPLKEIAKL